MTTRVRDELQSSLESIDSYVLVLEEVARVRKELIDLNGRCTHLVNKLCDAKQLLSEIHLQPTEQTLEHN